MQTSPTTATTTATSSGDTSTDERSPLLRLLPEDGIFAVLLLVIMVYTTVGSIQGVTPAWAPGLGILTATTGIGLLAGYICVQQRLLPEMLVQAALVAFGCYVAFVQTADAVLNGNRAALLQHMQTWFYQAVIRRETSDDNVVFLLFLAILSFLLAFITVWLVLRTRRPWLAALANGVVLLINLNSTSDEKAVVYLVIFVLATLLLLVRFTLSENMRMWRARGLRFSPDLSWDFMQAGSLFAVIVLLLAYLLPSAEPNSVLLNAWNSPQGPWQSVVNTWQTLFNGVNGRGANGNAGGVFGGGLQITGSVNLSPAVQLHYQTTTSTDDPSQYLMTQTYDTYDGKNTWHTSSNTTSQRYAKDTPQEPTLPSAPYTATTYVITLDNQQQGNPLFSPGSEPELFNVPAIIARDQSSGIPVSWTSTQIQSPGAKYTARGYTSAATSAQLRSVPYPADVSGLDSKTSNPQYPQGLLTLYRDNGGSGTIPPNVRDLARQITQGKTNMYDAATSLEDYLHGYKYSLQNPNPPADQDAIAWFLFTEKQGFCTYFASAMTLMARSLGMPARIVGGYAAGSYDGHSNSYIVKGTQAHVWTQIYFAGYGWINFEPTSSFSAFPRSTGTGTAPGATPGAGAGGTPQATPPGKGPKDGQDPNTTTTTPNGRGNVVLVDVGLSLSVIILLALLALAFFIVWWRLLYRGLSPVAMAFARVSRLGAWAGAPPRSSQTPDEYVEHLGRVVPGQRPALRELTQLYARERWGGGLPRETAGELPHLYDQVQRSLSRIIVQRLRHAPGAMLSGASRLIHRRRRSTNRSTP
ncbi:MAG: transglutaminase TgpA family protein [Ktedonobacterales bacterium]